MTNPSSAVKNSQTLFDWIDFGFLAPQATQDSDLLRQLNFIPGLKEILMLRQVHALEHATVWVLSETVHPAERRDLTAHPVDNEQFGGISTDQGFYLYGQVSTVKLVRAVRIALNRITAGEWNLAVHPRCGTNVSVGMLLTASLALSAHFILPRGPIEQLLGLGVAATTAAHIAPGIGSIAQRYLTTAVPFNLTIEAVTEVAATTRHALDWETPLSKSQQSYPVHFVKVRWMEL